MKCQAELKFDEALAMGNFTSARTRVITIATIDKHEGKFRSVVEYFFYCDNFFSSMTLRHSSSSSLSDCFVFVFVLFCFVFCCCFLLHCVHACKFTHT